jgi:hypothetical protein
MRAKKQTPVKRKRKVVKPYMSWQTGKYSRLVNLHTFLPYGFLLLCKLWDTPPETVLSDFMDNIAHGSWKREGRKAAKSMLVQYILIMGYGQRQYTERDIENMFRELDALGLLFPNDNEKVRDLYVKWRDEHYHYWFDKWYHKYKRNDVSNAGTTKL